MCRYIDSSDFIISFDYKRKMPSVVVQLAQNFIVGGLIVSSISYLGTYLNPVAAAIFWSYPMSILPSIYFMKNNGKSNGYISKFLFSTTFALVLLVLCTYAMSHYLGAAPASSGIWLPIGKASIWWLLGSAVYYLGVEYGGYKKYFM